MSQDRKKVKEQVLWTFGRRAFRLREEQVQRSSGGRGPDVWKEECGQSREETMGKRHRQQDHPGKEPANSPLVIYGTATMALVYMLSVEASKSQQQAQ